MNNSFTIMFDSIYICMLNIRKMYDTMTTRPGTMNFLPEAGMLPPHSLIPAVSVTPQKST